MGVFRRAGKRFVRFFVLLAIAGSGFAFLYFSFTPVGDGAYRTILIEIPRGTGFLQTVDRLDGAGLVTNRPFFYALALARGAAKNIRAGEYELSSGMSPFSIIGKLVKGDIKAYMVTIPEDITIREIAARLASFRLVDEKAFLALARDKAFLVSLGVKGESAEGYLYPETYKLDRSMGAKEIMRVMVQQCWKVVTPEMKQRASELGMSLGQVVTLASIIGRETGYREEKPLVSAVFHNRLRRGMRLQSDPTAVYTLEGFEGAVRRHHLLREDPFNTYKISGLPPGPIGNPNIDSIRAALHPAKVDYLYFVSNNQGAHVFSADLISHNQAVSKYQIQKKNQ